MTIPYTVRIGDPLQEKDLAGIESLLLQTFALIHRTHDCWNPHSELSRCNRQETTEEISISPELWILLQKTDQLVQATEGRFDPTVYPLHKAWRVALEQGRLLDPEERSFFHDFVGWKHLSLFDTVLQKHHPRSQMDLSGIAKGHCVDLLVERLSAIGLHHLYVEWGGEIRTTGHHPSGRPWRVALVNEQGITIDLADTALATSGDTFQTWTVQGKPPRTFTHIVDPYRFEPLECTGERPSVISVLATTCCVADAIATAAMTFETREEAEEWLEGKKRDRMILAYWVVARGNTQKAS